jgi:molybdopterin synthase catalytic subunit
MTSLAAVREAPLSVAECVAAVTHPSAGGIDVFIGVVRDHNSGQSITLLEYEAYPSMAEKEMARIVSEIAAEIPGVRLAVLHRVGKLAVGDAAVVCAASAPHRAEAFRACRLLIDRIKERVPVWKREHGPGGPYWVGWQDARCTPGEHEHGEAHVHEGHAHGKRDP